MSRRVKVGYRVVLGAIAFVLTYIAALVVFNPLPEVGAETQRLAMAEAAGYLIRHLNADGRFHYIVRLDGSPTDGQYNVLRHAGTVYALALYNELSPDDRSREAILRAGRYLLQRHVRPLANQHAMRAVFSLPGEEIEGQSPQVKLGGCALGLVALIKARELDPAVVSLDVLRELGNFILFMQQSNGRFQALFDEDRQIIEGFESLYYPGEAILALALLHQVDPDPRWLNAALKGIHYLEQSRQNLPLRRLPKDHWLMIATAAILPQFEAAQSPPISRQRMIDHSLAIGRMMMREQWRASWVPGLRGSFVSRASVTPTSTRLEGLVALANSLPQDHPDQLRLKESIRSGVAFILRGQVREGSAKGGFTGALKNPFTRQAAHEIRIDYVQHALTALVGHYQLRRH